jgi:hypothetical protein
MLRLDNRTNNFSFFYLEILKLFEYIPSTLKKLYFTFYGVFKDMYQKCGTFKSQTRINQIFAQKFDIIKTK